jgi:hypothetical protein
MRFLPCFHRNMNSLEPSAKFFSILESLDDFRSHELNHKPRMFLPLLRRMVGISFLLFLRVYQLTAIPIALHFDKVSPCCKRSLQTIAPFTRCLEEFLIREFDAFGSRGVAGYILHDLRCLIAEVSCSGKQSFKVFEIQAAGGPESISPWPSN